MARTSTALVVALALACAVPAHANVLAGGEVDRSPDASTGLDISVHNASDAGEAFQALRINVPGAGQISDVTTAGSGGACAPTVPETIECQFPPPYLRPSEDFQVSITTSQLVPDQAGVGVYACVAPCASTFVGPFSLVGPFADKPPAPFNAGPTIARWRKGRLRAGDTCTPATSLGGKALLSICAAAGGAQLRAFVVNADANVLALTIFGPKWVKRLHVPAYGGAGFSRRGKLKKVTTLTFVNTIDGTRASLSVRIPASRKRR